MYHLFLSPTKFHLICVALKCVTENPRERLIQWISLQLDLQQGKEGEKVRAEKKPEMVPDGSLARGYQRKFSE